MDLGYWIKKAMECSKWGLMGHPNKIMDDSGAEDNLKYGCLVQEGSQNNSFRMLPRDNSYDIEVKNMATFLPLSKESA